MTPQPPEADLQRLWQNQETEKSIMSVEEVRLKAQKFLRRKRSDVIARTVFAVGAAIFCGIVFMNSLRGRGFGFAINPVAVIAALVMAMLVVTTIRNVYLSFVRSNATYDALTTCLEFYRRELERQREVARQPVWQLVTALLIISWLTRSAWVRFSANNALLLFVLLAGGGLILLLAVRKYQARGVQEEIDALDRFEDETHG